MVQWWPQRWRAWGLVSSRALLYKGRWEVWAFQQPWSYLLFHPAIFWWNQTSHTFCWGPGGDITYLRLKTTHRKKKLKQRKSAQVLMTLFVPLDGTRSRLWVWRRWFLLFPVRGSQSRPQQPVRSDQLRLAMWLRLNLSGQSRGKESQF